MEKKSQPKICFLCVALMIAALCVPVSADVLTLTFQDVGLSTQDIDVFDAAGAYVQTVNSSSVLALNTNESARYTLQLKPQTSTVEPDALLGSLVAWLTNNTLIVVLVVLALMLISRGGRRSI